MSTIIILLFLFDKESVTIFVSVIVKQRTPCFALP